MKPAAITPRMGPKQMIGKVRQMLNHFRKFSNFGEKTCTGLFLYLQSITMLGVFAPDCFAFNDPPILHWQTRTMCIELQTIDVNSI